GRVAGDLKPFVILIEDAEFCAVVDREGGGGFFERAAADDCITCNHDSGAFRTVFEPCDGDASEQQDRRERCGREVESERAFESRTPLAKGENQKAEPKRGGGEDGPFVECEFTEQSLSATRGQGGALNLVASELEVGANVGVARRHLFGFAIEGNGFADLA